MCSDPDQQDAIIDVDTERTIVEADAHRPEPADPLYMQRWVPRVSLEQAKVLVGESADRRW